MLAASGTRRHLDAAPSAHSYFLLLTELASRQRFSNTLWIGLERHQAYMIERCRNAFGG